jgi:hypothetical protein
MSGPSGADAGGLGADGGSPGGVDAGGTGDADAGGPGRWSSAGAGGARRRYALVLSPLSDPGGSVPHPPSLADQLGSDDAHGSRSDDGRLRSARDDEEARPDPADSTPAGSIGPNGGQPPPLIY